MIEIGETIISAERGPIHTESLLAAAHSNKGTRPADVEFTFNGKQLLEKGFAPLQFSKEVGRLTPSVGVVEWQPLLLVLGVRRALIFKAGTTLDLITKMDFFRGDDDDAGFYKTTFEIFDEVLVAVYEGGSFAVSRNGEVRWHKKKHWDDELISTDSNRLVFMMEGGERYALDCTTGENVSL